MLALLVVVIIIAPQIIASLRNTGTAARLALLVFGLCAATAVVVALALRTADFSAVATGETYYVFHLSPLGMACIGIILLAPLFMSVEANCPKRTPKVDNVLVQTLALTVVAALWGSSRHLPQLLVEAAAIGLVLVLAFRGGRVLWQERRVP